MSSGHCRALFENMRKCRPLESDEQAVLFLHLTMDAGKCSWFNTTVDDIDIWAIRDGYRARLEPDAMQTLLAESHHAPVAHRNALRQAVLYYGDWQQRIAARKLQWQRMALWFR